MAMSGLNIQNILLDRDGTIIKDKHYLSEPEEIEFYQGSLDTLRAMRAAGLNLFLITNQSGIGRGYFSLQDYYRVHDVLVEYLAREGITFKDSLFCPHAPEDGCTCRKPGTGLWEKLSSRCGLLPENSAIIGDKKSDILFGHNCGLAASILVCTGRGSKTLSEMGLGLQDQEWIQPTPGTGLPTLVARDLSAVWKWLCNSH